ncbi:MAG: DUF4157 domain-containing protein [Spirulina sp. SIO3F2]|nr:DUF4157 domain-containing protein [Spirulina sp. SIO3F2]
MARRSYTHASTQTDTKKKPQRQVSQYSRPFPTARSVQQKGEPPNPQMQAQGANYNALTVPTHRPDATPVETEMPLMPKLTIGAVNDPYEQEADRMAAQVVQQLNSPPPPDTMQQYGYGYKEEPPSKSEVQPLVQRKATDTGGMVASPELEESIQRERAKGQRLADSIRQPMETAMGADFSGVRIHTGSTANQLSESIQAKAFTTGQDVFFRQGAYDPNRQNGQALLAHELTHVVQQAGATVQRTLEPSEEAEIQALLKEQEKQDQDVKKFLKEDKKIAVQRMPDGIIQRLGETTYELGEDEGGAVTVLTRKRASWLGGGAALSEEEKDALLGHVKTARKYATDAVKKITALETAFNGAETWLEIDKSLREQFEFQFIGEETNTEKIQTVLENVKKAFVRTQVGLMKPLKIVEISPDVEKRPRAPGEGKTKGYVKYPYVDSKGTLYSLPLGKSPKKMFRKLEKLEFLSEKEHPGSIHVMFASYLTDKRKTAAAKTIVHEATHKFAHTEDHEYGNLLGGKKELSLKQKAENADCYAWYAKGVSESG